MPSLLLERSDDVIMVLHRQVVSKLISKKQREEIVLTKVQDTVRGPI